ncbi:MAG TPA: carbamoyl-phosphate synthase small subunit, partial [Firmicutes bacterium]|nr:carbamoyl-phosphate synthase small subunit [Bacillota bacterium]
GKPGTTVGKLVFNTSMTGYHEILTDPSYAGEMITFTFPLIGIYGTSPEDAQSAGIHARGVLVSELSHSADSWRADRTLNDLLLYEGLTGISGIDTRQLTRHLRDQGEMLGVITSELDEAAARSELVKHPDFGEQDLVTEVTCAEPYSVAPRDGSSRYTVAAYDFGIKRGILTCLAERGCTVHVFPATATADELMGVDPDGVFLSNGPGDPERMDYALPHVKQLIDGVPLFGICLGHQLLARALDIPTYRLKFGNRGANHPVLELDSGRAHISSQNHSYAVALDDGPAGRPAAAEHGRSRAPLGADRPQAPYPHPLNGEVLVTHLNINDSSNEGIALRNRPVFSVQYHPEGCPGPRDNTYLFDRFVSLFNGG